MNEFQNTIILHEVENHQMIWSNFVKRKLLCSNKQEWSFLVLGCQWLRRNFLTISRFPSKKYATNIPWASLRNIYSFRFFENLFLSIKHTTKKEHPNLHYIVFFRRMREFVFVYSKMRLTRSRKKGWIVGKFQLGKTRHFQHKVQNSKNFFWHSDQRFFWALGVRHNTFLKLNQVLIDFRFVFCK